MRVFAKLKGLLIGRPMGYSAAEKQTLHEIVLERTRSFDFPIIAEMDFGHTSPQITLPSGCQARIETPARRFGIIESGVR